jgi:hypothetical protein
MDYRKVELAIRNNGNFTGKNNPFFGKHHTKESRRKMSEYHKGKKLSYEHRRNLSKAQKKRWENPEQLKKLKILFSGKNNPMYGRKHSDETKKKISEILETKMKGSGNGMYGKQHSTEALKKMSEKRKEWYKNNPDALRGKNHYLYGKKRTLEWKKNMSEKMSGKNAPFYGKHHSRESKEKLSKNNGSHRMEVRDKISKAHKGISYEEKYGIERAKKIKEKLGLQRKGNKNSNWCGGISFEPYGIVFTKELKEQIRQRDNYECQECHHSQEQAGYKLCIHHINYDKKNNRPENLIALCKSCHSQTNYSREDWIKYFRERCS